MSNAQSGCSRRFLPALAAALLLPLSASSQVFVNAAATGLNDGSSWSNAYTELRIALANNSAAEIWVAAGTYYPGNPTTVNSVFPLKNNRIYGGFAGTETSLDARDPAAHPVILSGNNVTTNLVQKKGAFTQTAVLDGLTLRDSTGASAAGGLPGGALHVRAGSVVVTNCVIANHAATSYGAAIFATTGPLTIDRVLFTNLLLTTTTTGRGGAVAFTGAGGALTIRNTAFADIAVPDTANNQGGAVYFAPASGNGTLTVTNCTFRRIAKPSTGAGGAIYAAAGSGGTVRIAGSDIREVTESAGSGVAIAVASAGSVQIRDTTIGDLVAFENGGIINSAAAGTHVFDGLVMTNCVNYKSGTLYGAMCQINPAAAGGLFTIRNSRMMNCSRGSGNNSYGGVFYMDKVTGVTVSNCVFSGISMPKVSGGVLGFGDLATPEPSGALRVLDSQFLSITNGMTGGVADTLYSRFTTIVVSNNVFRDIAAGYSGGAMYHTLSYVTTHVYADNLFDNVIANRNVAGSYGGALAFVNSSIGSPLLFIRNVFRNCGNRINQHSGSAVGFSTVSGTVAARFVNNVFAGGVGRGAVAAPGTTTLNATFAHCTFGGNTSPTNGAAIWSQQGTQGTVVTNCIVYGNVNLGKGANSIAFGSGSVLLRNSVIEAGGYGGGASYNVRQVSTKNPLYENLAMRDLRTHFGSIARDYCTQAPADATPDVTGYARPNGVFADAGAYEADASYVPPGEWDTDGDGLPDVWERLYFTDTTPTPEGDPDQDGRSNRDEYIVGTDPSTAADRFVLSTHEDGLTNAYVTLPSIAAAGSGYANLKRYYSLERCDTLLAPQWAVVPGVSNVVGLNQLIVHTERAVDSGVQFFRGQVWLGP